MNNLGDFNASGSNTQVYCFFTTTAQTGAALGPSDNFEVGDLRIYKDGSTAERNNTSGYAVSTNFDSMTGAHLFTIDLTDNTVAGFYASGHTYTIFLKPDTETIDGLSVCAALGQFTIGMADAAALRLWGSVDLSDLDPSDTSTAYGAMLTDATGRVWDVLLSGHQIVGSFGAKITAIFSELVVARTFIGGAINPSAITATTQVTFHTADLANFILRAGYYVQVQYDADSYIEWTKIASVNTGTGVVVFDALSRTPSIDDAFSFYADTSPSYSLVAGLIAKFTGITSIANWLRAVMRKDNIDTTTINEINATTGSGTGTYAPSTDSTQAIRDRGDAAWTGGGGGGSSGPVEHAPVPKGRILQVCNRVDGTFDVIGKVRMRVRNGNAEKLWWALELKDTQLAFGDLVDSVEAPTTSGADAANASVTSYGVFGTLVKFFVELDPGALSTDDISILVDISPDPDETLIINVPVEVAN